MAAAVALGAVEGEEDLGAGNLTGSADAVVVVVVGGALVVGAATVEVFFTRGGGGGSFLV